MTVGHPTPVPRSLRPSAGDAWRVGVGGAAGAVARWALVAGVDSTATFPWPTLVVNLFGCFMIGALTTAPRTAMLWAGLGFAGGLTTFSTFAVEVASLLDGSDLVVASAYVTASVAGGAAAVILGRRMAPLPRSGRRYGTSQW